MAIVFVQQQNKQKKLIFIMVGALLLTIFVLYQGFFKKSSSGSLPEQISSSYTREIKIDFTVLKNPILENLQPFAEIAPLEVSTSTKYGKVGRENPFLPY